MAFFQLVLKAKSLKKASRRYHEEKLRSIEISKGGDAHYTLGQQIRRFKIIWKQKIRSYLRKLPCCPENSWLYKKMVMLQTDGTLENYVLKSIFGFISGVLLTYMFFIFFVFQLHFSLTSATLICGILGVVLTVGLAFSPRVRCIVFLFLPQFFSKRGRQAMMAYAFILALSGPAKNTLHNLGVLSESLACGQEQLKEAVKAVLDLMKQPFYALRDSLAGIVKAIKAIVMRIKRTLIALKRLVIGILRVIKSVFEWLGSVVSICNKKMGTPYDRCQSVFEGAVADCQAKLGPLFSGVCNLAYVASAVCYVLKPLDLVCVLVSFVSDSIIGTVRRKIKKFAREMKAMFYVKIKFSHSFHMETNKSRSFADISSGITTEIKTKTARFFSFFDWMGFITSFFFLILVLKVIRYRHKWLTSDRFDNRYITRNMRDIDIIRARQDKETIFPLSRRERSKYASLSSVLLIKSEKLRLSRSIVFLATTSVKLGIYMITDYCLFWLLSRIRFHGRIETKVQRPSYTGSVKVEGQGFLADIYRSIIRAFAPHSSASEIEAIPCLPDPRPPDFDTFAQIGILVAFCWIMAFFEPYGLRLRHVVLNNYYPDRAKQRAVWLYNQIIRSRGSFLKYARRQLRRQFGTSYGDGIEKVTLRERIWAVCPLLNKLMPLKLKNACLVCGQPERGGAQPHFRCPTPGCVGVYCEPCYQELHRFCSICKSPLEYGDLTDISEERDSSDDQVEVPRLKIPLQPETKEAVDQTKLDEKAEVPSVQRDISDDDSSSKYSYSYQLEPSTESAIPEKVSFKDVEAQEIRDDVTMQIFSEILCENLLSGRKEKIYCLVSEEKSVKRKSITHPQDGNQSDSTSIANTESWTTEEIIDQKESVLEIEIEDFDSQSCSSFDELLSEMPKKKAKQKRNIFKKISKALRKILPFIKKKKKAKHTKPLWSKNYKDSIKTGHESEGSSSSISSLHDESYELLALPKAQDRIGVQSSALRKRSGSGVINRKDGDCVCRKTSQKSKRSLSRHKHKKHCYPHMMKFETKELPRHLKTVCSTTKYFEIDESSSHNSPKEHIQFQADISTLSDTRSSADSDPSRDRRSSTNVDDNDSYIYTSENNERRYETHSPTSSGSSIPEEDIEISETTTDITDNRWSEQMISTDNEMIADNEKMFNAEDKIDEDSDEKGLKHKKEAKPEKTRRHSAFTSLRSIKDRIKSMAKAKDAKSKGNRLRKTDKPSEKKVMTNEKSDILKKDKVEKETANAQRRDSLAQMKATDSNNDDVRKVDKSVGVEEKDIDKCLKQVEGKSAPKRSIGKLRTSACQCENPTLNERCAGGKDHHRCHLHRSQEKEDQQKLVHGFLPIVSESFQRRRPDNERGLTVPTSVDGRDRAEQSQIQCLQESHGQPGTRDQGTYVRLKSKRYVPD